VSTAQPAGGITQHVELLKGEVGLEEGILSGVQPSASGFEESIVGDKTYLPEDIKR
jgi:hypothetical protein